MVVGYLAQIATIYAPLACDGDGQDADEEQVETLSWASWACPTRSNICPPASNTTSPRMSSWRPPALVPPNASCRSHCVPAVVGRAVFLLSSGCRGRRDVHRVRAVELTILDGFLAGWREVAAFRTPVKSPARLHQPASPFASVAACQRNFTAPRAELWMPHGCGASEKVALWTTEPCALCRWVRTLDKPICASSR
jgi:hypothetical protein